MSPRRQSYIVPPQANRELTDDGRAPRRRAGPDRDNVSPRGFRLRSAGSGNRYAGKASARPRTLAPSTIHALPTVPLLVLAAKDRQSGVSGKLVSSTVDFGGRRHLNK